MISLDFYGFRVCVRSDSNDVIADVQRDFSYFRSAPGGASADLEVITREPLSVGLPAVKATLQTPRNTVYRDGDVSYVAYSGRALMICRDGGRTHRVYCQDRDLAHEIAFLTILSRVGQHLDSLGLHRVHALGLEVGGRAILVLLPMAGGKTTLALRLLGIDEVKLLSEDSPLISRSGKVYPFPLRIGVRVGEEPADVPARLCRTVRRMEFCPKTLIDIEHFGEKIGDTSPIGSILLGERWLAGTPFIRPASRRAALKTFLKDCVIGLGLYQGMEFLLERSSLEILGKTGLALSRLRNSLAVITQARVCRFGIGPDKDENARVLIEYLRGLPSDGSS
jgi:hypothetical protein